MKSVKYSPGVYMKKYYSYIIWIFSLIIFFFVLHKTDEANQAWCESYLAKLELERFYRSRLDEKKEEEIRQIIRKAEDKRAGIVIEENIRQKMEAESQKAAAYVRNLAKTYPHVKGRIIIPGTKIDFPVVQGKDNDFYLDHDYDNSYYINGGVFIDHVHKGDFSDDNTVIYGHNVRIGYIFHDLDKFRDKNFIKKHSEIIIDTPVKRRIFDVVCAMDVKVDANYRAYSYDGLEYENYLNLIRKNNILKGKPLPTRNDKIITLSTCSDISDRYAVVAIERKDTYIKPKNFDYLKERFLHDRRLSTDIFIY